MKEVTPDDIRKEHQAAMAALTEEQRHSPWRERHARQMMNFNGQNERRNLQAIFEREAQARNAAARRRPAPSKIETCEQEDGR
jgi:hypothetical protein